MNYSYDKANLTVNTIKILSALSVEKANSGHPGGALGCADLSYILWQYFLKFYPKDPSWKGRDLFILSGGHLSVLQYTLLCLYGYKLNIEDLKNFRQLGSITPGHPEYMYTPGIETTTGPLGQGVANAVGFSMGKKYLANYSKLFDSKVYCLLGDGDIMEGITSEAASLAGHLKLDNLICVYDSNSISIEGNTDLAMSENIAKKFEALNWEVLQVQGHDHTELIGAFNSINNTKKPKLLIAKTCIAKSAGIKEGSACSHGAPLGEECINELKKNLHWTTEDFLVPELVKEHTNEKISKMKEEYQKWKEEFDSFKNSKDYASYKKFINNTIDESFYKELRSLAKNENEASRKSSNKVLQIISKNLKSFIGGSADLGPSNLTIIKDETSFKAPEYSGRNIHFGVREHAMGAIANGLSLNGPFIPYVATFLVFSDYMRTSIRLSALMKRQIIYIFTHDSIYVGEDGPTHQPVEQLSLLRLIPNLNVIRPMNDQETVEAYLYALECTNKPSAIILSRQDIKLNLKIDQNTITHGLRKGAYVVKKETKELKAVAFASGAELSCLIDASSNTQYFDNIRIVSVPILEKLNSKLIKELVSDGVKKIIVEAGSTRLWPFFGEDVLKIGIEGFGVSAKGNDVAEFMGIDTKSIRNKIIKFLK